MADDGGSEGEGQGGVAVGRRKKGFLARLGDMLEGVRVTIEFGGEKKNKEKDDSFFSGSDLWDESLFLNSGEPDGDDEDEEEPVQCAAETKDGSQCSRNAEPGSEYCWQHHDML